MSDQNTRPGLGTPDNSKPILAALATIMAQQTASLQVLAQILAQVSDTDVENIKSQIMGMVEENQKIMMKSFKDYI